MKTLTILFVTVIMMGVGCSKNEDSGNNPDKPDKPSPLPDLPDPDDVCSCMDDIIFMQYCYDNFDVNKDGKVSVIEANAARKIDINSECASVKGIERFPNIEILSLNGSSITELDLRYNLKLKSLSCQDRQLTTVLLPNTLTAIAFSGCSSLTEINLPASLTSIGESAFYDCSSLTEIHLPANLTSIGEHAFNGCSSLTGIHLPDNLTSIGESAFYDCSSLTEIHLPASLTSIGGAAFRGCSSLTEIHLPASLTSIGAAFGGCSGLTEIHLPDNLTSIESSTFNFCSSLTEIHLPANLTSIGERAFWSCSSLTEIHLPASLTSIGGYAFDQCTSLMKIMCYALTPPTISGRFLFGFAHSGHLLYNRSENLYVPAESTQAYKDSDWASYFENILPIE